MIEADILNYLTEELDVPVIMQLPEVPSSAYPVFPPALVVIERVGGSEADHVKTASFAFQSYGDTLYNTVALDERVREAMSRITDTTDISGAHLASNYNFTDPETKRYRYQCVYDIYYV